MPVSQIEVRTKHSQETESALIQALQDSLLAAFRIPPEDRHIRLVVHEPHLFWTSPALARPELYTLVTIDAFAGRTAEAKRNLFREIVVRFESLGIPKDHVTIIVRDFPTENWGLRGGHAAADIDLGFEVEV